MNDDASTALVILAASGLLEPGQMERSHAAYAQVVGTQTAALAARHRTAQKRAQQAEDTAPPNRAKRRRADRRARTLDQT